MNNIPHDLQYTRSHEWVRILRDETVEVGITDHAQGALGELVFIDVRELGRHVIAGHPCAVVESVNAVSAVYSPVSGTIAAANAALKAQPSLCNQAPYAAGWLVRVRLDGNAVDVELLSAEQYARYLTDRV